MAQVVPNLVIGLQTQFFRRIVDGLSLCTVDERELVSNALEQFVSTAAKLLDFFLLADTCTLRLRQLNIVLMRSKCLRDVG